MTEIEKIIEGYNSEKEKLTVIAGNIKENYNSDKEKVATINKRIVEIDKILVDITNKILTNNTDEKK